jgi:hypothetical protein
MIEFLGCKFKKQDLWIGAYWDNHYLYICLIPCFPLKFIHKKWKMPKLPRDSNEGTLGANE